MSGETTANYVIKKVTSVIPEALGWHYHVDEHKGGGQSETLN